MSLFYSQRVCILSLTICMVIGSCYKKPIDKPYYLGQNPPGLKAKRFAINILFSVKTDDKHEELHSSVYFSPDNKEMYYTVQNRSMNTGIYKQKIMMIELEKGKWSNPKIAPFSGKYSDSFSSFSTDGKRVYFESDRPNESETGKNHGKMWYVEKLNSRWGEAIFIGSPLPDTSKIQNPSYAENSTVYFKRSYPKDGGSGEILSSRYYQNKYEEPLKLGPDINTGYYENFPSISPDESYLIFYRLTPGGQTGMFISTKNEKNQWSPAIFLGKEINSGGIAFGATFSPDRRYLFYLLRNDDQKLTDEPKRDEGIYWVDSQILYEVDR